MKIKKFGSVDVYRAGLCLFICFLINCVPYNLKAQPPNDTLKLIGADGEYPLWQHLYIYKTNDLLSPEYIYGKLTKNVFLKLGPEKSYHESFTVPKYYWMMFTVCNYLKKDKLFYLQLNSHEITEAKAYRKGAKSKFYFLGRQGANVPFNERAYSYYDPVWPLTVRRGETATIIVSIDNNDGDNIHFLPQLRSASVFKIEEERFYIATGTVTGIMLFVLVMNCFLGIAIKEKLHLLYAVYILIAFYEIMAVKGTDVQFFYPGYPEISSDLEFVAPCILAILMTWVMKWFLDQNRKNSRMAVWVDIGMILIFFLILFNGIMSIFFIKNRTVTAIYENLLAAILLVQEFLLVFSAIEKVLQKNRIAWFYLIAVMAFLGGLAEYIIMIIFGSNQEAVFKDYPNNVEKGLLFETIVVFLGIVYRYNLFKQEKEKLTIYLYVQQQDLIKNIIAAEEAERKRIAADLHDDVGATLSALSMYISNAKEYLDNKPEFEQFYRHGLTLSNKAVNDIRDIAHNLLPKDFTALGLFTILEERVNHLNANTPIRFALITEGDEKKLNDVLAITVYRIINELLNNICKHSMAAEAAIQILIEGSGVQIMAEDDGIGFNSEIKAGGIGLRNIKDRVEFLKGHISVDNNNGTQIIIYIPL